MSSERKAKQKSKIQEICCPKGSQLSMVLLLPLVIIGDYFSP